MNVGVLPGIADHYLCGCLPNGRLGGHHCEKGVEGNYSREATHSVSRHLEANVSPAAITDRSNSGRIYFGPTCKELEVRQHPRVHFALVRLEHAIQLDRRFRIIRFLPISVNVHGQCSISQLRKHICPHANIVIVAPPLRTNQDARARS